MASPSAVDVTFALNPADGHYTQNRRFNLFDSSRTSIAGGTWIELADEVAVAADESDEVPFTITVPDNPCAGDNAVGVATFISNAATDTDGAEIGMVSRVGFRVLTRVTGDLTPTHAATDDDGADADSGTNDDEGVSTTGIDFPSLTAAGAVALAASGVVFVYAGRGKSRVRS